MFEQRNEWGTIAGGFLIRVTCHPPYSPAGPPTGPVPRPQLTFYHAHCRISHSVATPPLTSGQSSTAPDLLLLTAVLTEESHCTAAVRSTQQIHPTSPEIEWWIGGRIRDCHCLVGMIIQLTLPHHVRSEC